MKAVACSLLLVWIGLGLTMSCVTEYQPGVITPTPSLVVEGLLTNRPGLHTVLLTATSRYENGSANPAVTGAQVSIVEETGRVQPLPEAGPGQYQTPANYRGRVGETYRLRILTKDGNQYESAPERMRPVAPIDSLYWTYSEVPIAGTSLVNKGFDVFLDTRDPATPGDFYRWQWTHYEPVTVCDIRGLKNANPTIPYSFLCCTRCWDVTRCANAACVNIGADVNINGNAISQQFIFRAPYDGTDGYFANIEQLSLTPTAYQFLDRVRKLTQNNGGLFDPAPGTVGGNMRNLTTPGDAVFGYFGVSASAVKTIVIDRSTLLVSPALRPPPPPQPPFPPGPRDCADCVESNARTASRPPGWMN